MVEVLTAERRAALKPSFVTRRVSPEAIAGLQTAGASLRPGDVVVAQVTEIGHHTKIEKPNGRRAALYLGDEVLLACGARYAPDQFEAAAPTSVGPASLAAAGGVAGVVTETHERMKPATSIRIVGAAMRSNGTRINLSDVALPPASDCGALPVIAVVGVSMNSGKTHSVASLVRGLRAAGKKVAALKATGSGAGGDLWLQLDAGAELALDFTDVGFATTYRVAPSALEDGARRLLAAARDAGVDIAVMEIADGLRQPETAALLASDTFRQRLSGVVFAAGDALGAERGVFELTALGHRVLAVGGLLTRAPLMIREASQLIAPPVLTADALSNPDIVGRLLRPALAARADSRPARSIAGGDPTLENALTLETSHAV